MTTYNVLWEIEVDADSPKEAAIEALKIQQDTFSEAVAYTVVNTKNGTIKEIDLLLEMP